MVRLCDRGGWMLLASFALVREVQAGNISVLAVRSLTVDTSQRLTV